MLLIFFFFWWKEKARLWDFLLLFFFLKCCSFYISGAVQREYCIFVNWSIISSCSRAVLLACFCTSAAWMLDDVWMARSTCFMTFKLYSSSVVVGLALCSSTAVYYLRMKLSSSWRARQWDAQPCECWNRTKKVLKWPVLKTGIGLLCMVLEVRGLVYQAFLFVKLLHRPDSLGKLLELTGLQTTRLLQII